MRPCARTGIVERMRLTIVPLDPADGPMVEGVQGLREAAEAADIPDFPPPCPYELRAELARQRYGKRTERFVALVAGEVAGYLVIDLRLKDNLDNADLGLTVHPAHRRRGIGRALHAYAVDRVRAAGRKRITGASVEALPGGPDRGLAGRAFGTAMGAKAALDEVRRRLDVTTADRPALAAMHSAARDRAGGYQVVTWCGRTPDRYLVDVCYLDGRLLSDAPIGDLTLEPEVVDEARLRDREELCEAARIRVYSTGAVHTGTGKLVALTALGRSGSSPWHAFQWITLVDPEHRGHRLGALVKSENLRFAGEHEPELRMIDTWNAATNMFMIAINEAMGFRPVDSWINWQQEV
jgi:GNAT superfamily N-acetyltransferase